MEDISALADQAPDGVRPRIGEVVDDLNLVIGDIRRYIMDLRPTERQGRRLDEARASLISYLEDRAAVSVTVDIELAPPCFQNAISSISGISFKSLSPILRNTPTPIMSR